MKKSITPRNEKGEPHGYWEQYYSTNYLAYNGNYINGKQIGYYEYYHYSTGEINKKMYYIR